MLSDKFWWLNIVFTFLPRPKICFKSGWDFRQFLKNNTVRYIKVHPYATILTSVLIRLKKFSPNLTLINKTHKWYYLDFECFFLSPIPLLLNIFFMNIWYWWTNNICTFLPLTFIHKDRSYKIYAVVVSYYSKSK